MPMTMTQKILAAHCGRENLAAGEMILADTDLVLGNDVKWNTTSILKGKVGEKMTTMIQKKN